MDSRDVTKVIRAGRGINGWFAPGAAHLFGLLDQAQQRAGIAGNLFEIGVHHGKSAVLLSHMRRGAEVVQVCDVFGDRRPRALRRGARPDPVGVTSTVASTGARTSRSPAPSQRSTRSRPTAR